MYGENSACYKERQKPKSGKEETRHRQKSDVCYLRDKERNITTNIGKIVKVAGELYRDLVYRYSVETSAFMPALRNQGVVEPYIKMLQDIYSGSTAIIAFHKESNKISIKKNVIQRVFTAGIKSPGLGTVGNKS